MSLMSLAVLLILATGAAAETAYQPFIWLPRVTEERTVEKAAVLIPIQIKGCDKKLFAQLDTGADLSSFYGPALRAHGIEVDSVRHPDLRFKWCNFEGDYEELGEMSYLRWDMGNGAAPDSDLPNDHIVATIAMDRVAESILILDFPNERFAVLDDSTDVDALIDASIHYERATFDCFKFCVDLIIGTDTVKTVRFDTGASSLTTALPLRDWQRVTGLTGEEDSVERDSVRSWGKIVQLWTAPAIGDLKFGPIEIPCPSVTYVDWPDEILRTMSFMGSVPFADSCVVVLDCVSKRFGVAVSK
jgi:hypothetical protein